MGDDKDQIASGMSSSIVQDPKIEVEEFNEGVCALLVEKYPEVFVAKEVGGEQGIVFRPYPENALKDSEDFVLSRPDLASTTIENYPNPQKAQNLREYIQIYKDLCGGNTEGCKEMHIFVLKEILQRPENVVFSREGITFDNLGPRAQAGDQTSLRDFSEKEILFFKRICEYRDSQHKVLKAEREEAEKKKMTIEKLRDIL